jgi:maltose alpha-D-glucosyltransferase / alpha-amylase
MIPALEWAGSPETLLQGPTRAALERDVLPGFLQAQRWFGGKARRLDSVSLADWGEFPAPSYPAAPRRNRRTAAGYDVPLVATRAFLALFTVRFAGGTSDLYFLPLAVAAGAGSERLLGGMGPWVLARLSGPGGDGVLIDALADDDFCAALLDAVGSGRELATREGKVRGLPTSAFASLRGDPGAAPEVSRGPATSSNSLVFYGGRLLLKLFRRLEVGVNPDFEVGRFLTEQSPFDRTPPVAGALEYSREGSGPVTLALLQALVPNQGDGWQHALDELRRYFEAVSGRTERPAVDPRPVLELAEQEPPPNVRGLVGGYLHAAATLGRRTAELHLALARDTHDPAFAPEPLTPDDLSALREAVLRQGRQALDVLKDNIGKLPEAFAPAARRLLEEGPGVLDRLAHSPPPRAASAKTRCHGDYHLGQVLWADGDFLILDFEGEPVRTVEERRGKQSPLRDVAGMLRSYHYAAYAALFTFTQDRPHDFARLEPWAELWQRWASACFLRAYRATAAGSAFLPDAEEALSSLLDAFMLEKAFYELVYELNNRPGWVRIPLRGILDLIGSSSPFSPEGRREGDIPGGESAS